MEKWGENSSFFPDKTLLSFAQQAYLLFSAKTNENERMKESISEKTVARVCRKAQNERDDKHAC